VIKTSILKSIFHEGESDSQRKKQQLMAW